MAALPVTLLLPGAAILLWRLTGAGMWLQGGLLSLGLDSLRAAILAALAVACLGGAAAALFGRPVLGWIAAGAWYAGVFLTALPGSMGPRPLPYEHVDQRAYALALLGLGGLGLVSAGLGAAFGRGLRSGLKRAARLAPPRSARAITATALITLLVAICAYGAARAPDILIHGPWAGVTQASTRMHLAAPGKGHPIASASQSAARQVTFRYRSTALGGVSRHAVVILPAGYDSGRRRYPVLYLLHGSPGTAEDWPAAGGGPIAAAAHQAGRAPAMIIVCPDGVGPRGGAEDSWADNYVPGDLMESDLIHDLIPAVDAHFRTLAQARFRGVGGLSSGGYGAANLALRHPHVFSLALVFSGSFVPPSSAFGGNPALRLANDPMALAAKPAPAPAPFFYVGWGAQDLAAQENARFASVLTASGYGVRTQVVPGSHEWSVWRTLLWDALNQAGSRLAGGGPR